MDPSQVKTPPLKDLTIDNITENVNRINSNNPSPRLKFLLERLVQHLHDFSRETRLSVAEWRTGLDFLAETGRMCSPARPEFILLVDILGWGVLVDSISHPKPPGCTDNTVLGPFHTHETVHLENGAVMSHDENGDPMLLMCTVKDVKGNPIPGVNIDIWEADSNGLYDMQLDGQFKPEGRCVMTSDEKGEFWVKCIVPVPYPIPHDGPVGQLLRLMQRHAWRPAHIHFKLYKQGWDTLITALFPKGTLYEDSDAIFGVKASLIVDLGSADADTAKRFDVKEGTKTMRYDFVLATEEETALLRDKNSKEALEKLGMA